MREFKLLLPLLPEPEPREKDKMTFQKIGFKEREILMTYICLIPEWLGCHGNDGVSKCIE